MATAAPSEPKPLATAPPSVPPPPVTSATLPSKRRPSFHCSRMPVRAGRPAPSYLFFFFFLHFFFLADSAERLCFFLCFLHFFFVVGCPVVPPPVPGPEGLGRAAVTLESWVSSPRPSLSQSGSSLAEISTMFPDP